jgi:Zn-dependent protease
VIKLLLLLFGGLKFGKVLLTGGTMLLSVFAYGLVWGWPYALGFVLLIFAHEMGHYVAARQRGLAVGAPTFIPFVGAWIELKEQLIDPETEAYVAMAGPVTGTVAAMLCYYASRYFDSGLLLALAYSGLILNLFNLIPLKPLDGGRITAVLSPRAWIIGLPILLALFIWRPSPLLLVIGILALPHLGAAIRGLRQPASAGMAPALAVPTNTRLAYGTYYLALAGFLAIMATELHGMIRS